MIKPILYSFRRCPYAMRARLAIQSAGFECELREIVLRDKAPEFLEASVSATVPCLVMPDQIIDESFDIMTYVLGESDPEHWLAMPQDGFDLIAENDGPFKQALDRYKYANRYKCNPLEEREKASVFLRKLDQRLANAPYLYGRKACLADMAIAPFVRQFANTDKEWFDTQPWTQLSQWLDAFVTSDRFIAIMRKYPKWIAGDPVVIFPHTIDIPPSSP